MTRINRLCLLRDGSYKIHVVTGLAAALWVLLLAVTGVMINHQESLGLLDTEISDNYLPDSYRADVRTGTTRLNIIVTDLHSGRIFGAYGTWVSDLIALFLFMSITSGAFSYWIKRRSQRCNQQYPNPKQASAREPHPVNGRSAVRASVMPGEITGNGRIEGPHPTNQPPRNQTTTADESRSSHIGTL